MEIEVSIGPRWHRHDTLKFRQGTIIIGMGMVTGMGTVTNTIFGAQAQHVFIPLVQNPKPLGVNLPSHLYPYTCIYCISNFYYQ